jgi:hypothetical protein
MREWDTEEETLASRGNGQHEPYLVVSKDEVDARVDALEAENEKLKRHIHAAMDRIDSDDVIGAYTALLGSEPVKENSNERRG